MATIISVPRVKGTRYKAVIRLEGIKPYSRTFKTRKAAQHWVREQESDVDMARAGGDVQAQRMTLAELCDDYMMHGWMRSIAITGALREPTSSGRPLGSGTIVRPGS